jgi:hypothetical protein
MIGAETGPAHVIGHNHENVGLVCLCMDGTAENQQVKMRANPPLAVIANLGFIFLSFHAGTIVLSLIMCMAISIISWLSAEDTSRNRKLREIRPRSHIETSMMDGTILPTILKTENLILGPLGEEPNDTPQFLAGALVVP